MIDVTVKTLDSQNHQFNVDENLTVEQFKNHIAESVNIPATSQRIIYCGRVLQDTSKLSDYDLDNKVVHLVQRAPPSASNRNVRSLTPPPDFNRARTGFRGFDRAGNPVSHMYVGSMTLPQNLMEPQQVVPPRATHTLSSSRLNVARRMLRNAENVIRQLENSEGNAEQQTPTDETVDDEMTPVIEARVIVPTNGDQPIDENEIISAVHNTIFPSIGNNMEAPGGPSTSTASTEGSTEPQPSASAPETPRSNSTENLNAEGNAESLRDNRRSGRRLRCRGTEMATLLTTLNQLQARFAPFLAHYQSFMQDDPQVAPDDLRETRLMLNRVSKVLHYLGHAYHSLSDIIVDADQPPPRLLLCRPILIQPPTLVQAGIPIQLEAQISLSADRPTTAPAPGTETSAPTDNVSSSTPTTPATPTAPSAETTEPAATQPTGTESQGQPRPQPIPTGVGGSIPPGFMGLPMMSGGSMRVFTTPVEIRTVWPPNAQRGRPVTTNNNNNTAAAQNAAAQNATSGAPTSGATNQDAPDAQNQPPQNPPNPTAGAVPNNDGSMEFFMEVTPEAFRGGNLLQNLMQMIGNQLAGGNPPETSQTGGSNAQGNVHQSQARSTQTNPTTATHTRSTARPHVHMTQQAIQGGFDPFLHCYSHHVSPQTRSQRVVALGPHLNRQDQAATNRDSAGNVQSQPTASNTPINLQSTVASHLAGIMGNSTVFFPSNFSQLANIFGPRPGRNPQETSNVNNPSSRQTTNVPEAAAPNVPNTNQSASGQPHFLQFLIDIFDQVLQDSPDGVNGPTLDMYMQSLNADPLVEGESLIFDLIMLMVRNLRISDLFSISNGNLAPFERQLVAIRNFFLTQVCQNDTSDLGIGRATERIMADFAPIKSALESVPPRDNIDMVRTVDGFFRQRVPPIIRMAINLRPRTEAGESQDAANFVANIWSATRDLLTLAVHCSANGQEGVQNACNELLMSTFSNNRSLPNELHRWTVANSRTALSSILGDLNASSSQIEQYVVRNSPNVSENQEVGSSSNEPVESMEVDYSPSLSTVETAPVEDPEPLPNVIWGSESWHGQTPEEWVPIIARDVQKQRRQEAQPPFSDAYLSGMPSKRRRLINSEKPPANVSQVISEGVRRVVTNAGLTSAAPLDQVVREAGESPEIQTAYRNLLQSTVQNSLRNNEDFDPARYPNVAHYFDQPSTE